MRTREGRLKILDFGLAKLRAASGPPVMVTEPGLLIGTPAYMAPEQLNGAPADARADVFAMGAVFYEYICGVHPLAGVTPLATIARVLESDARPLVERCPHVPVTVAECVERCLRKVPDQRYASASEVLAALDRADASGALNSRSSWWRTHQLAVIALYLGAAALGWQIKEWVKTPTTVAIFVALGAGGAIGGVLRGHLVFTEQVNRRHLLGERRRAATALLIVDLLIGGVLVADAAMLSAWPLSAVLTMALGIGIALAALVLEPATTRAALGET